MTMNSTAPKAASIAPTSADATRRPLLGRRGSSMSIASTSSNRSTGSVGSNNSASFSDGAAKLAVAPDSVAVTKFSSDVEALMKHTQVARNVLPMIVRGGTIAAVGMLLFGHFAPIAILGTMVGALVGGYMVAKFMQLRLAKQMTVGANAQMMDAIRVAPEGANAADIAKQKELLSFIEGGNVFRSGVAKAYVQPYKAAVKSFDTIANGMQARLLARGAQPVRPGSPTLTETGSEFGGQEPGDIELKEVKPGPDGRFTTEQKGKGRADGKVFARQSPLSSMPELNDTAAWAKQTSLEAEPVAMPSNASVHSSQFAPRAGSMSTLGLTDEKEPLLGQLPKSASSPELALKSVATGSPKLSRSPTMRSMAAYVSDTDGLDDDSVTVTPKNVAQS